MGLGVYETVSLAIITLVLLAAFSIFWKSWRNGITPMPSSHRVRRAVAAEVNRLGEGGLIVEAGSGWGTMAVHLGKHCKGWRVDGVENSPIPLAVSRMTAWFMFGVRPIAGAAGDALPYITFRKGDLFHISYREAQAVVAYLYPGAMSRLSPLLEKQLSPGACIISVCFALPGWQPERVVTCSDMYRTKIYVYKQATLKNEK